MFCLILCKVPGIALIRDVPCMNSDGNCISTNESDESDESVESDESGEIRLALFPQPS